MRTFTKLGWAAAAAIMFFSDVQAQISSANVTINTSSAKPANIFAKIGGTDTLSSCSGTEVTLSVNNDSLGTDATWHWYVGGINPENHIGTGASIIIDTTNNGSVNKVLNIYVRAEGGTCAPVNADTAHLAFTVLPLPNGTLEEGTFCEGEEYQLTFKAATPTANGPFDLSIFYNSTTADGHIYSDITSEGVFDIHTSQLPVPGSGNTYNLMQVTDAKGCVRTAL